MIVVFSFNHVNVAFVEAEEATKESDRLRSDYLSVHRRFPHLETLKVWK